MVEKFNVEYIPGGATQNSIRVAQVSVFTAHSFQIKLYTVIGKILFKFSLKRLRIILLHDWSCVLFYFEQLKGNVLILGRNEV